MGLALKTDDIEATHARLKESGVEISDIRDGRKSRHTGLHSQISHARRADVTH